MLPPPDPALITGRPDHSAASCAASASQWRMTNKSVPMAVRVRIVSLNDSPLIVEERSGLRSITCAPRRCAALSKESLVRVDASKKAVVTVAPAMSLDAELPTIALGTVEQTLQALPVHPLEADEALLRHAAHAAPFLSTQTPSSWSTGGSRTRTTSSWLVGRFFPDVVGPDRKLTMAAVDEDRQFGLAGPADIGQGIEGGAHGSAGVEHVVDHDHAAV